LPPRDARIFDAGLCHGTAGLLHVFNRLYQSTHNATFLAASRAWIERTLAMRTPNQGVAGFTALVSEAWNQPKHPRDEVGVLSGAAGIGLALLAATTPVAPAWDRMLLLS
jgi:lantibiotic biosynthesis protein